VQFPVFDQLPIVNAEQLGTKNAIERHTTTIERGCVQAVDAQTIIAAATHIAVRRAAQRTVERDEAGTAGSPVESTARPMPSREGPRLT